MTPSFVFSREWGLFRLFEHADEGDFRFLTNVFRKFDAGLESIKAGVEFFEGIHLHVAAVGAGAVIGWSGDEVFFRDLFLNAVKHAGLGDDDDVFCRGLAAEVDHFFGGADFIGKEADGLSALGVCNDLSIGILGFDFLNRLAGELDVDVAVSFPKVHFTTGLLNNPLP